MPLTVKAVRSNAANGSVALQVITNVAVQMMGKGASAAGALVVIALVTRLLGVTEFGQFTLVMNYLALFYVVTDLGASSIAVREMAKDPPSTNAVAGQLLTIKAFLSGLAFASALLLSWALPGSDFGKPGVRLGLVACGVGLLAVPIAATAGAVFQTRLRMSVPAIADGVSRFAALATIVAVVVYKQVSGLPPSSALVLALLASGIGAWVSALISFAGVRKIARIRPTLHLGLLRPIVADTLPLSIVLVLGIVHYRLDVFVLQAMRGTTAVGQYGVATKLLDIALQGAAVFMGLAFPVLSARARGDRLGLARAFHHSLDLMIIVACWAALVISVLAPLLVPLLFGPQFVQSVVPVAVIAWAIPATFANTVLAHMVIAENQQIKAVPVTVAAIVTNLGLNVLLIPHLGFTGPAYATLVSETVGAIGTGIIVLRHYRIRPITLSTAWIAGAVGLAALVAVPIARVSPLAGAVLGSGVYALVLLRSGVVNIRNIRSIMTPNARTS